MKKFLVVVDIQNDFVNGSLGSTGAESIIDTAAKIIRDFDGEIFATLDTHFSNYLQTAEGKNLPVEHCIKGTVGWVMNPTVKAELEKKGYTAVVKNTFGSLKLPQMIEQCANGEEFSIELIGLCTDICVVSNAIILKAHFPEANISVNSSACAGVSEQSHEAALATMKMCQINIIE